MQILLLIIAPILLGILSTWAIFICLSLFKDARSLISLVPWTLVVITIFAISSIIIEVFSRFGFFSIWDQFYRSKVCSGAWFVATGFALIYFANKKYILNRNERSKEKSGSSVLDLGYILICFIVFNGALFWLALRIFPDLHAFYWAVTILSIGLPSVAYTIVAVRDIRKRTRNA